ncbi:MAG: FAD-dependent oxidoreductase [Chloroflexi bacterium]|nr:FAD-dependent oxidoreductase [Chloroflexota bacterium]
MRESPGTNTYDTHCCIVGGGPGGMVLALLLGRQGIPVTLLEEHEDFERDFRGDTIHPSTMEVMDDLGLADRLLRQPHTRIDRLSFDTPGGSYELADFRRLPTQFPYITMMPQARFLDFLAGELRTYPNARLLLGANAQALLYTGASSGKHEAGEHGPAMVVRGVRYRSRDAEHEIRAPLTVGADGRFSRIRRLAGLDLIKTAPPMDVLWFRLPRYPGDPEDARGKIGHGHLTIVLDRGDVWQIALVIAKGSYQELRTAGLPELRRQIATLMPEFADRVETLQDWRQVSLLSVESGRVQRWYRPGLLLIGDAAHAMSPVGGVGINYAIQDAVVAANVLTEPLRRGRLRLRDLAAVQRRREWPTRIIQMLQGLMQERAVRRALSGDGSIRPPAALHLPMVRDLPARIIGLGIWPAHPRYTAPRAPLM